LEREGHLFRLSQPRFHRTALAWILSNRFCIGELHRNGQVFEGHYKRLIDRATFDACQDIMNGRNRRTGTPQHLLAGGLLQCTYCGQSITGERVCRKLKGGDNAYLVGTVEEAVFKIKSNELKAEAAWAAEALAQLGDTAPARGETALALFGWAQRAADV